MSNKKISVIIPVYNREKYLDTCIKSVLNQENVLTEIVLIDDGSTDKSLAICEKYAKVHTNIKVIHTENKGVSHARNVGLNAATGEYVTFLDSDDSFTKDALYEMQNALEEKSADYVIGRFDFFSPEGSFITTTNVPAHYLDHLLNKNEVLNMMIDADSRLVIGVTAKLFKMDIWKHLRFREDAIIAEDDFMTPAILEKSNSIAVINKIVYHCIFSKESLIRSKPSLNVLYALDSNLYVFDYCISVKNYNAALFRFGFGTRKLLDAKKALRSSEAKEKLTAMYKKYCKASKELEPHVNMKNKLRFKLFRTNLNVYDFVRQLG